MAVALAVSQGSREALGWMLKVSRRSGEMLWDAALRVAEESHLPLHQVLRALPEAGGGVLSFVRFGVSAYRRIMVETMAMEPLKPGHHRVRPVDEALLGLGLQPEVLRLIASIWETAPVAFEKALKSNKKTLEASLYLASFDENRIEEELGLDTGMGQFSRSMKFVQGAYEVRLRALSRLQDRPDLEDITNEIVALGERPTASVISFLRERKDCHGTIDRLVQSPSERTRFDTIWGVLMPRGDRPDLLMELTGDDSPLVLSAVTQAGTTPEGLPVIDRLKTHPNPYIRECVADSLKGVSHGLDILRLLAASPELKVRKHVALALHGREDGLDLLETLGLACEIEVQRGVVAALAGRQDGLGLLRGFLGSPNETVRWEALKALAWERKDGRGEVSVVIRVGADDPSGLVRCLAARALARMAPDHPDVLNHYRSRLSDPNLNVRGAVAYALGFMKGGLEILDALASGSSVRAKARVVRALKKRGDGEEILKRLEKSPERAIQRAFKDDLDPREPSTEVA